MREGKGEKEFKGKRGHDGIPIMFGQGRHTHVHTKSTADPTLIPIMLFFVCCPRDYLFIC